MSLLRSLLVLIVVAAIAAVVFAYSGVYDVAATHPENPVLAWFLSTTMDESVHRHARDVAVPSQLSDPELVRTGLDHYRDMCVECHGAPGVEPGALGKGLDPEPPELGEAVSEWTSAELFWIVKNGVRMSGMPAWGATHTDDQLWTIVAFLQQLPLLSPEAYQQLVQEAGGEHSHTHP